MNIAASNTTYYGVFVGRLPTLAHAVTGDVYIVDSKHFLIRNFVYDGTAPSTYIHTSTGVVGYSDKNEKNFRKLIFL